MHSTHVRETHVWQERRGEEGEEDGEGLRGVGGSFREEPFAT